MSRNASLLLGTSLALVSILFSTGKAMASYNLPDPYEMVPEAIIPTVTDTIPLEDRFGNWTE
ncbi:MAG: hypothetical protein KBA14_07660, partial [Saprospiraceae bacterium]|nr:hypothetical protein [Saprospiraceae bacterium]